jgi:AcrR family transcriptional regulator
MLNTKRTPPRSAKRSALKAAGTTPAPRRRTQAERREATRKIILESSIEVMAEQGCAGLRMEDVERRAGVSRGALLHHFPTKQNLIFATFEYVNDRSLEQSRQRTRFAQRASEVPQVVDAIVADATEFFFSQGFFIEFALAFGQVYSELRGSVHRISNRSRFAVEATWREALESHGLPRDVAADVLNLTLNMVRGFMVRRFMDDNPNQRARLTKIWQDMVRCYLMARLSEEDVSKAFPSASAGGHASMTPRRRV